MEFGQFYDWFVFGEGKGIRRTDLHTREFPYDGGYMENCESIRLSTCQPQKRTPSWEKLLEVFLLLSPIITLAVLKTRR
jgi:hypothetical protein